jgi:glycosyltransferase involved in cell wall biosynthesis
VSRTAAAQARPIGLLVKTYPKLSETFILEEILGLEAHGLPLHIFSLQRPTDAIAHAASRRVQAPVSYLPPERPSAVVSLIKAHIALLSKSPRRYLETLLFGIRLQERNRTRAFVQAVCLAHELTRIGVLHLHVHFASEPAGVAELVSRLTGISYSISAHAKDIYLSSPDSLRRKLRQARFTVTCTEYNRIHLSRLAGPGTTVLRMYHGVDPRRFHRRPVTDCSSEVPLLLSVGRLREKKGFAILIEACRLLRDTGTAIRCQIVGYGEQHDQLQSLIARHALHASVRLAGKMAHEQLIELYREAAVFALPCQIASDGDRDGIPNVVLEALAMEIAVVSTNVSGIPEVIEHGVNGLLVEPGDANALAGAIRLVLEEPELRKRLGAAGRRTIVDRFCNETNLGTVRDLLLAASHGVCCPHNTPVHAQRIYGE